VNLRRLDCEGGAMSDDIGIRKQIAEEFKLEPGSEAIAARIAQGFAQAERGELFDAGQAIRILQERHAQRRTT